MIEFEVLQDGIIHIALKEDAILHESVNNGKNKGSKNVQW